MNTLPHGDDAARDLIRHGLDDTVIVEAAAGTGKTTELVERILNVIASGRARVEEIVAVTFTEKAAGELKLRLRKELESRRQRTDEPAARAYLSDAIARLEEAHVSTIHGFCADLLRERPVEAGVDPLFEVLTEARADRIYDEAFRAWLGVELEHPPEGVRRALRRSVWSRDGRGGDDGPVDRLWRAGRELLEWRDFSAPWRRDAFDRDASLRQVLGPLHDLAGLSDAAASRRDTLFLDTIPARELSNDIRIAERFDALDLDALEARLVDLAQHRDFRRARRGREKSYGNGVTRDAVWAAYQALGTSLDRFQRAADCDLAALLHDELAGASARYEALKRRAGSLDFVDLLLKTRDLLVGHRVVRDTFRRRFKCIFVDEFQDSDPLQAEILLLLASADPDERDWRRVTPVPGKLFIVGDPKQAIYRFRRADVETYRQVCDLLAARGGRRAFLHTSFRSTPAIQAVVNAAFAPLMTGDRATLQADYRALMPYRSDNTDQPAVVVLPVPEPYGQRRIAGYAIEKSLPDAVGAFVAWLLKESGWGITERTTKDELPITVPIEPRHVCILFRRFLSFGEDMTRAYVDALEARGVPHLLVGGKSFHDREEVETIRAALAAIEWPDDELSVFATLRGALFAIGDEELLEYRHPEPGVIRHLHPFRIPETPDPRLQPIAEALAFLRELHARRNYRPVADTIAHLLETTRAHVGFVLRSAGEQALANVLHVAELARQYEADGGISFRGFVEALRDEADDRQAGEAPILEEGSDGVRLMTVHKAKGLEFPVVILADMTAKLRAERADRLIDRDANACYLRLGRWTPIELASNEALEVARDEAEGVRVAYVAATRARDLLVVPGVGDVPWDAGWTSPLNAAVYPEVAQRRTHAPAPACPIFKKDSVLRRPDDEPASSTTVCPGLHALPGVDGSGYPIVWWDPHALALGAEPTLGIRRESLIVKDVPEAIVEEGRRDYERWHAGREGAIARGSAPSLIVRTATEWAKTADARSPDGDERRRAEAGEKAKASDRQTRSQKSRGSGLMQRGLFDDEPGVEAAVASSSGDRRLAPPARIVDLRGDAHVGGARFGELAHAILAASPLDADASALEAVGEVEARILSASADETTAAVAVARRVLDHELLTRARASAVAGRCRREAPVAVVEPDGTLVEGIADLAFEENGRWIVVDFKTDRELSAQLDVYTRQVQLYADAISTATGLPAEALLVRI